MSMEKVQKESLLDVLLYLFENYMDADHETFHQSQRTDDLSRDLLQAGFEYKEIQRALRWIDELQIALGDFNRANALRFDVVRVYSAEEQIRITDQARNYIFYLERLGFIDAKSRELIIDRALTLEERVIDVNEIKWIALTVLLTQPEKKDKLAQLEALVLSEHGYIRH